MSGTAGFQPFPKDLLDETIAAELAGTDAGRELDGDTAPPVLIALDNVTWDDPDACGALLGLPAAGSARRVLWLLSGTGEPGLHGPSQNPYTIRLTLAPLRPRDSIQMATDRLGGVPDAGVGRLIEACGGHPGLLVAVLDALIACAGHTVRGGVARLTDEAPPPPVLTALLRDDPRLSARTRALMATVAGQQHPVRIGELMQLPHERAVPLLGAVREAAQAGVLVVDSDRLRFRHALVREAATLLTSRPAASLATAAPQPKASAPVPARTTVQAAPSNTSTHDGEEPSPLSPAEHNIVRLVADGLTNRQIASRVGLSPHTVNFHLRKIFRKRGVSSRVELVGTHLHLLRPEYARRATPLTTQESRNADAG